jgi:hypothetical protein
MVPRFCQFVIEAIPRISNWDIELVVSSGK